jgi:hypothetical protein
MELKKFNLMISMGAFLLGTIYMFSDGASITANVIGAGTTSTELTAMTGLFMILASIGLFIVSINSTANHSIDLERLVRRTKDHSNLNNEPIPEQKTEFYKEHTYKDEK